MQELRSAAETSKDVRWLDCTKIVGTDCYCDDDAIKEINESIDNAETCGKSECSIENRDNSINAPAIHFFDNGNYHYMSKLWTPEFIGDQDGFLESMAAAAQAVVNYFQKKQGIIYISVMNNMSIDCDCVDHPEPVKLEDYGILASTDPVALDQACIDIINQQKVTAKNDPTDLLNRIDKQHGTHTIDHAEKIGLGSKLYSLVELDIVNK